MKRDSPDERLFDDCFRILTETEEVLTRTRDVFRGLAHGLRNLTSEEAASIATVLNDPESPPRRTSVTTGAFTRPEGYTK